MKTAISATKTGIVGFTVPYIFAFNDSLLLRGSLIKILISSIIALSVIFFGVIFLEGCIFKRKISNVGKNLFLVSSILLIYPSLRTQILGFIVGTLLVTYYLFFVKKLNFL